MDVVGEGNYQQALISITGRKTEQGHRHLPAMVQIRREPNNPYDPNAVQCLIQGKVVGYINREDAPRLQEMLRRCERNGVKAEMEGYIVRGWKRTGSEGNYGVKLGRAQGHDYNDRQWL
jgi:HIRAN domain